MGLVQFAPKKETTGSLQGSCLLNFKVEGDSSNRVKTSRGGLFITL